MDEETRSRIQKVRAKVVTEKSKTLELQSQVTDYDLKKTLSNVLMWLGDVETILTNSCSGALFRSGFIATENC